MYCLQCLPLLFSNSSIALLSYEQTIQASNINGSNFRVSLVLVMVLLNLRPLCNILQRMGFKLKVVICLNDYNRHIGGPAYPLGNLNLLLYQMFGGKTFLFLSVPQSHVLLFPPWSSKTSFPLSRTRGSVPSNVTLGNSLTGVYIFWGSFGWWHSSCILWHYWPIQSSQETCCCY